MPTKEHNRTAPQDTTPAAATSPPSPPLPGQLDFVAGLVVGYPVIDLCGRQWLTLDEAAAFIGIGRAEAAERAGAGSLAGALKMRYGGGVRRWWIPFKACAGDA